MVRLRAAISRGEIRPGEPIRIKDWSDRLGVSPTPLREALRLLEVEGRVHFSPQRGFQAASFSAMDLLAAYRIWRAVHTAAIELTIDRWGPVERASIAKRLHRLNDQFRAALESDDTTLIARANYRFHRAIFESADSPVLERIRAQVYAAYPFDSDRFWTMVRSSEKTKHDYQQEHAGIINAIEIGDAKLGVELASHHAEAATMRLVDATLGVHGVVIPIDGHRPSSGSVSINEMDVGDDTPDEALSLA